VNFVQPCAFLRGENAQGVDVKRIWNLVVFTIAIIYFLMDAIFATVAIPLSKWLAARWCFERIRLWIVSLRPYPTLALFVIPLVILEPAKPVAAYLIATGHVVMGVAVLAICEILKLVIIERLFSISRDKLLSIPAFAWCYGKYAIAKAWLTALPAWQVAMRWRQAAQNLVARLVSEARRSSKRGPTYLIAPARGER
jgi:hypothetical protein